MAGRPRASFTCPNCQALYEVVKVEAGPETTLREVTCLSCKGPFPAREGKFVLKYFMLREVWPRRKIAASAHRREQMKSPSHRERVMSCAGRKLTKKRIKRGGRSLSRRHAHIRPPSADTYRSGCP
jgi:predicted Zn finger-like uncharacterized protein